jgi:hypothetical protein
VTDAAVWTLSPDAALAELHGESVVLHLATGRYYAANATATALFTHLKAGATRDALAAALVSEFGIARASAEADVDRWLALLSKGGLVRERAAPPCTQAR